VRWDEKMYLEDMVEMGLSEAFAAKYCRTNKDGTPSKRAV
jgi:hypothetical protein